MRLSSPSCVFPRPHFLWHLPGGEGGMSLRAEKTWLCALWRAVVAGLCICKDAAVQYRGMQGCTCLVLLRKRLVGVEVLACSLGGIPSQLHDFCRQREESQQLTQAIGSMCCHTRVINAEKKSHTQSLEMGEGERVLCSQWSRVGWARVVLEKK